MDVYMWLLLYSASYIEKGYVKYYVVVFVV